jgi:hypothetical protein
VGSVNAFAARKIFGGAKRYDFQQIRTSPRGERDFRARLAQRMLFSIPSEPNAG